MGNNENLLELKGVSKKFNGVLALKNVDFEIRRGEIRALIGENGAGKSTMMNCILGSIPMTEGVMLYKGKERAFNSPAEALKNGISMIHQEISLVPTLDISENIWAGREEKYRKFGFISNKQRIKATEDLLEKLEIDLDPKTIVSKLTVAQRQLVEIVRAVSYDPELIIMDEPTSALSDAEIEKIYKIIRLLASNGTAIIFISHKLDEIYEVCKTITVMRDGEIIDTRNSDDLCNEELISLIAGRELDAMFPKTEPVLGEVILECKNLQVGTMVNDVSFSLRKGEILGICGLMGAGRTEVMRAVYGLDKLDGGELYIEGKKVNIRSPKEAIEHGIGMITEDRLISGTIGIMSVRDNMSVSYLKDICNGLGFVNRKKEKNDVDECIRDIDIQVYSQNQIISEASGGNQQKVIIGRWLLTQPKILILDEPTRGIDVGAKAEIHRLMDRLVHNGMSVIMVSSELPEIIGMSDRIIVLREGKVMGEFEGKNVDQVSLMNAAFGINKQDEK